MGWQHLWALKPGGKPIGSLNFCHRFGVLAFYFSLKDKEYQLAIEQGLRVQQKYKQASNV
jgi:hypothetical protein